MCPIFRSQHFRKSEVLTSVFPTSGLLFFRSLDFRKTEVLECLAAQEVALSGLCVVVEDTVDNGGVGEWLASHRSGRTLCISTGNRFLPHGSVNDLYRHCGLDADGIAEFVMEHRKETGLG